MEGDAAADQAAHLGTFAEDVQRDGEDGLHLGRVGLQAQLSGVGDVADEGVDAKAGDEGSGGRQFLAELDSGGVEADLLLRLAQRGGGQIGVALVPAPAGKRDLARVAAQVRTPLGKDEARLVGPAVERQQDRRVDLPAQMITWTVPPSTDQAAPLT